MCAKSPDAIRTDKLVSNCLRQDRLGGLKKWSSKKVSDFLASAEMELLEQTALVSNRALYPAACCALYALTKRSSKLKRYPCLKRRSPTSTITTSIRGLQRCDILFGRHRHLQGRQRDLQRFPNLLVKVQLQIAQSFLILSWRTQ